MGYLGLAIVLNYWIWEVFRMNIGVGLIMVVVSVFWYKGIRWLAVLGTLLLMGVQFRGGIDPFWRLEEARVNEWQLRVGRYPESWVGTLIEGRGRFAKLQKFSRNLTEAIDINQYFFAGHPTERVGVIEFAKFHWVMLPLALLGISEVFREKWNVGLLLGAWLAMGILGARSSLGPLGFFPVITTSIVLGIKKLT